MFVLATLAIEDAGHVAMDDWARVLMDFLELHGKFPLIVKMMLLDPSMPKLGIKQTSLSLTFCWHDPP